MMKPQPKREIAIDCIHRITNIIIFYASHDAVEDLREFGEILKAGKSSGRWLLIVDTRYDFDEVMTYIKNYGEVEGDE